MLNRFRFFRQIETKEASLAEPDAEMIDLLAGVPQGEFSVTAAQALQVPAVAAAIRTISEAAATLEINVVRLAADGTEAVDNAHPAARLLRDQANDWLSSFELIRDLTAEALTRSEGGMAWVNRVEGKPVEIIHYRLNKLTVQYRETGEPEYRRGASLVPARDVIHLRGPFSRSPVSLAADAIGVARVLEQHAGKLFKNGARPSGVLETPKAVGDKGIKNMLTGWRAAHEGSDNAGKTAVLYDGTSFRPLTFNSVDAQFLELRKFQTIEIARAFRVPPSMLYELDRATWSNSEQMGREFLTYTLEPWLRALEGAFRRALFTEDERKVYRVEFVRDDLTRADLGERATAYSSLIASRVINPNTARKWEGLPAYPEGEAYTNPNISAVPTPQDPEE